MAKQQCDGSGCLKGVEDQNVLMCPGCKNCKLVNLSERQKALGWREGTVDEFLDDVSPRVVELGPRTMRALMVAIIFSDPSIRDIDETHGHVNAILEDLEK